jgi:hypothetical protein
MAYRHHEMPDVGALRDMLIEQGSPLAIGFRSAKCHHMVLEVRPPNKKRIVVRLLHARAEAVALVPPRGLQQWQGSGHSYRELRSRMPGFEKNHLQDSLFSFLSHSTTRPVLR